MKLLPCSGALAVVCIACARDARQSSQRAERDPTPEPAACHDSLNLHGPVCRDGTVRRSGDTLYLRLANGRDTTLVDQWTGELPGGYQYQGRVGNPPYHAIESYGHEESPTWILVNPRTGRTVSNLDPPTFSPDSTRFAALASDWDNCTEGSGARLAIWELTDSVPVRALSERGWDCSHDEGWAAGEPRWLGNDTLEITRIDFKVDRAHGSAIDVQRRSRVAYVHGSTGWRASQR